MSAATAISSIDTFVVEVPLPAPIPHPFLGARTKMTNLVVLVRTADGCTGFGYVFAENAAQVRGLREIVKDLGGAITGSDALRREMLVNRMQGLAVELLNEGAAKLAISTIDIALWDICGKQAGLPLWKLLGGFRDEVPAYASEALWRHSSIEEIEKDADDLVTRGFKAMKLRLGGRPIAEEVERAKALRRVVGPSGHIMTDALWGYSPTDAIRLARAMEEAGVGLAWLEEPVREGDFAGLKRVRDVESTPVAAGERISDIRALGKLIDAIDHSILDIHHLGGITSWIKAAAILEAANMPISGHAAPEIHAHLLAAFRTGAWIEHFPWWDVLFEEPLVPVNGMMKLSDKPGLGLTVSGDALKRLRAS